MYIRRVVNLQFCQPSVKNTDTSVISLSEMGKSVIRYLTVKIPNISYFQMLGEDIRKFETV